MIIQKNYGVPLVHALHSDFGLSSAEHLPKRIPLKSIHPLLISRLHRAGIKTKSKPGNNNTTNRLQFIFCHYRTLANWVA